MRCRDAAAQIRTVHDMVQANCVSQLSCRHPLAWLFPCRAKGQPQCCTDMHLLHAEHMAADCTAAAPHQAPGTPVRHETCPQALSLLHVCMQAPADATPGWAGGETPAVDATPTPKRQRSRWDETPMGATPSLGATPAIGAGLPMGMTPGATPMGGLDMATPSPSMLAPVGGATPTAEQYQVRMCELHVLAVCMLYCNPCCA